MNNNLQMEAVVERVVTELEAKNNKSVPCSSCQKCKHATEEAQELLSTEFKNEDAYRLT